MHKIILNAHCTPILYKSTSFTVNTSHSKMNTVVLTAACAICLFGEVSGRFECNRAGEIFGCRLPHCEQKCQAPPGEVCQPLPVPCFEGCYCRRGWIRDKFTRRCITLAECEGEIPDVGTARAPPPQGNGRLLFQRWSSGGACDRTKRTRGAGTTARRLVKGARRRGVERLAYPAASAGAGTWGMKWAASA